MNCKYLNNYEALSGTWQVTSCAACFSLYVPSISEINSLCRTDSHVLCPVYLKSFEAIKNMLGQGDDISTLSCRSLS